MAKKPTISTLTAGWDSAARLNSIFTDVLASFDNTLSRDGSTPNAMEANFDLGGYSLINVGTFDADQLTLNGTTVTNLTSNPNWRSEWVTGTFYGINDLVRDPTSGNVYICIVAHTAGTFSTDLAASRWELFSQKGADGADGADGAGGGGWTDLTLLNFNSVSGSSPQDITSIPSCSEIQLIFYRLSLSTTANLKVQLGSGGVPRTSFYAVAGQTPTASSTTDSFYIGSSGSSAHWSGIMHFMQVDGNDWTGTFMMRQDNNVLSYGAGSVMMDGAVDMVRLIADSGTPGFDAGKVLPRYR